MSPGFKSQPHHLTYFISKTSSIIRYTIILLNTKKKNNAPIKLRSNALWWFSMMHALVAALSHGFKVSFFFFKEFGHLLQCLAWHMIGNPFACLSGIKRNSFSSVWALSFLRSHKGLHYCSARKYGLAIIPPVINICFSNKKFMICCSIFVSLCIQ